MLKQSLATFFVASVLSACGGTPQFGNPRYKAETPKYSYSDLAAFTNARHNTEKVFVILAFSGGGTRAAALSYGVLEVLRDIPLRRVGNKPLTLLDEVDVISSTSGGSFTSAFYGLFRDQMFEKNKKTGLSLFEERVLKRNLESKLFGGLASNLLRLNTSAVNRSDLAAEIYSKTIFQGARYSDLLKKGRPLVIVNAHDLTKNNRFEFVQSQFDLICSDLGPVPVGRAVTASSAVHGIFAPIKLRNHPIRFCPPVRRPRAKSDGPGFINNPRDRARSAALAHWYRYKEPRGITAKRKTPYFVHLADGGVVDNLGLRAPIVGMFSPNSDWGISGKISRGEIKKILLIVVNSDQKKRLPFDRNQSGPTISEMLKQALEAAMKTVKRDSIRFAGKALQILRKKYGPGLSVYGPVVVEHEALTDAKAYKCFSEIGTRLSLPAGKVDALRGLAHRQLVRDREFVRFLRDMRLTHKPTVRIDPKKVSCPLPGNPPVKGTVIARR